MLIDLHCHTKATKQGDNRGRNVSSSIFKSKIEEAGVSIVGITNHNHFDNDQYLELKDAVEETTQVWPGVELDIAGIDDDYHMLLIASPLGADSFRQKLETLFDGAAPDDFNCTFENVWALFGQEDAIFIPHCHSKRPCVSERDIEYIQGLVNDDWRVFYEPSSLTTVGIWANHGRNMILGSDVCDWNEYESSKFSTLRLPVDSFEQFCLLAQRDQGVIQTLLDQKSSRSITVYPHADINVDIPVYEDINVIFGQKGTGKSEILKSLKLYCEERNQSLVYYAGGEKILAFDKLLETAEMDRDTSLFGRENCSKEISYVCKWSDEAPTAIKKYLDWGLTRGNNRKRERFKIAEGRNISEYDNNAYLTARGDYKIIEDFTESVRARNFSTYLDREENSKLEELLGKMATNAHELVLGEYFEWKAIELANKGLATIKQSADKKSNTQSRPGSTGFQALARERVKLAKALSKINQSISSNEHTEDEYLGTLEDKGELRIVSKYRYLCASSQTAEFDGGIRALRKASDKLQTAVDMVFTAENPTSLQNFIEELKSAGVTDTSSFVGLSKFIILADSKEVYEPSDGEKGVLLLEKQLLENADWYLIDEPELGMSNLYINSVIRPRLQDLAKARKTVVVVTHNANLAVRTLPYSSVYREHVCGTDFRTFIGNPFTNDLVDCSDDSNRKSWAACSMTTLEGGREAFYCRKEIYEAGKK